MGLPAANTEHFILLGRGKKVVYHGTKSNQSRSGPALTYL